MPGNKQELISDAFKTPFIDLLKEFYINQRLSSVEISEKIYKEVGLKITTRSIQRELKKNNLIRSLSDAFNNAITKGRKKYDHLKKMTKSSELRRGISPKLRYAIFKRDGFRCLICGKNGKDDILVIDHINPVVSGGNNDIKNLRTLCRECNTGKMLLEERKI